MASNFLPYFIYLSSYLSVIRNLVLRKEVNLESAKLYMYTGGLATGAIILRRDKATGRVRVVPPTDKAATWVN